VKLFSRVFLEHKPLFFRLTAFATITLIIWLDSVIGRYFSSQREPFAFLQTDLRDFPFAKPLLNQRFCSFPREIGSRMVRGWAHPRTLSRKGSVLYHFKRLTIMVEQLFIPQLQVLNTKFSNAVFPPHQNSQKSPSPVLPN
jgi:hypothetical protein